jgi:hypothetical protein
LNSTSKYYETIYFSKAGKENTKEILIKTKEYINNCDERIDYIVISSTTGYTANEGLNELGDLDIPVIVCRQDLNEKYSMKKEVLEELKTHCEVYDIPRKYITDIIGIQGANILRNFSQGTKVCVELLMYLMNISRFKNGDRVVILCGTLRGADTAISFEVKNNKNFKVMNMIGLPEK